MLLIFATMCTRNANTARLCGVDLDSALVAETTLSELGKQVGLVGFVSIEGRNEDRG